VYAPRVLAQNTPRSDSRVSELGDGVYTHVVNYTVVPAAPCPTLRPTPYYYYGFTSLYSTVCANWSGGAWEIVEGRKGVGHFEF
jgi:hypothetical protein